MPLESLKCTGCGSADVQEVKPNTYFCNHCETLFKHVDPASATMAHRPAFCVCGNPVQVQCSICHETSMCRTCEATRAARDHWSLFIPTVGFGYVLRHVYEQQRVRPVVGERVGAPLPDFDSPLGPLMPVRKIVSTSSSSYMCWPCASAAVSGVAARITAWGPQPRERWCDYLAGGTCVCCKRYLCSKPAPLLDGDLHGIGFATITVDRPPSRTVR